MRLKNNIYIYEKSYCSWDLFYHNDRQTCQRAVEVLSSHIFYSLLIYIIYLSENIVNTESFKELEIVCRL